MDQEKKQKILFIPKFQLPLKCELDLKDVKTYLLNYIKYFMLGTILISSFAYLNTMLLNLFGVPSVNGDMNTSNITISRKSDFVFLVKSMLLCSLFWPYIEKADNF